MFFQDSRDYQILFLSVFLLLGIATRDWTIQSQSQLVVVVVGGCLLVQAVMMGLVRLRREKFSEDLKFQTTGNQNTFQGLYVMRRPYREEMTFWAAQNYKQKVKQRQEKEAQTLAKLTG